MLPVARPLRNGAVRAFSALLLGTFVLGCSLKPTSKDATLSLVLPNPNSSPRLHGVAAASWSGFACYAVNVIGPGIADSSPTPEPAITDFSQLIAGTKSCSYRGIVSPSFAFPANGGEVTIDLQVPPGIGRIVQLVGITDTSYCTSNFFAPLTGATSGAYEIGHAVADIFEDSTVSIPITYQALESKRVDCGNASASPATVVSVPDLSFVGATGTTGSVGSMMNVSPTTLNTNGGALTACGIKTATTALPSALTVNPVNCEISGTPATTLSPTTYTLIATNSAGDSLDATVTLSVVAGAPSLSFLGATGTTGTFGVAMSVAPTSLLPNGATITACGIKAATTALPAGFTVDGTTCVISGTPTATLAATNFTLVATNSAGVSADATVSLTVNPDVPTLSFGSVTGTVGTPLSVSPTVLLANGAAITGCATKAATPAIPNGLSLNPTTCVISGTPTTPFSPISFTLIATNSAGNSADATFSFGVNADLPVLGYTGATGTTGTVGTPMSVSPTSLILNDTSLSGCTIKVSTTPLPAGLSVDPTTCVISGTPTVVSGFTNYTIVATNSAGNSADAVVSLSVDPGVPLLSYASSTGLVGSVGLPMNVAPSTLNSQGATLSGCGIKPATTPLPHYLTVHPTTCVISGNPSGLLPPTGFTLVATNSAGTSVDATVNLSVKGTWAWMHGSSSNNQNGVYGTKGISSSSNVPGSRMSASTWTDGGGNHWLFGGGGYDSISGNNSLNDLWKYSPGTNQWTWMAGSNVVSGSGIYGTQGSGDATTTPGARYDAMTWSTPGELWLYGGVGTAGVHYDLWKFTLASNYWTWVQGSSSVGVSAYYGTQGTPAVGNHPGSRSGGATWVDTTGNLWLFGGSLPNGNTLNDLWKYNPGSNQWAWMGGPTTTFDAGTYGTQGTGSTSNIPGNRGAASAWVDDPGNFWLFGGVGFTSGGGSAFNYNDLWKFSPVSGEWTWVRGSSLADQTSVYGTVGVPNPGNAPGARYAATAWSDPSGDFWIFGGNQVGSLFANELWRYSPTADMWTYFDNTGTAGTYNAVGVPHPTSIAGGRQNAVAWSNVSGDLFLMGGNSYDTNNSFGKGNDLWKFRPSHQIRPVGKAGGNNGTGSTSLTIPKPANLQVGRLMIAGISVRGLNNTSTPPPGWTQLGIQSTSALTANAFYKVADASDVAAADFTWNFVASGKAAGGILVYSGVDSTSPILANNFQTTSFSVGMNAPSVTSSEGEFESVVIYALAASATVSPPAGYTGLVQEVSVSGAASTQAQITVLTSKKTGLGPTGTVTATSSTAADNVGFHVLLKKAP